MFTCFKNATLQWYTFELSVKTEDFTRYDQDLKYWIEQLLKKFNETLNISITIILRKRYTMNNARRRKEFKKYAFIILRTAKSTNMNFVFNQIVIIYNDLNVESQRNIIKFDNVTSLNVFLRKLNDFKHI